MSYKWKGNRFTIFNRFLLVRTDIIHSCSCRKLMIVWQLEIAHALNRSRWSVCVLCVFVCGRTLPWRGRWPWCRRPAGHAVYLSTFPLTGRLQEDAPDLWPGPAGQAELTTEEQGTVRKQTGNSQRTVREQSVSQCCYKNVLTPVLLWSSTQTMMMMVDCG